jgi:putative endonuclease
MKVIFVYIMTNWNNKVLYTGYTSDLPRRIFEHKNRLIEGFTKKYNTIKLVYFENIFSQSTAEAKEKQIKGWVRSRKIKLIETKNPEWEDLADKFQLINKNLFMEMQIDMDKDPSIH